VNLGFLASHDGTNMQSIIDACRTGTLPAIPVVVISNNAASGALVRAKYEGLPNVLLNSTLCGSSEALDQAILDVLVRHNVDIVVLAGYMRKLGPKTLRRFAGAVLNVHPALLPNYGGKGMYGSRVHEAVLASGDRETGASIHLVDEEYDTGPILAQSRVPVQEGDTAISLGERVRTAERKLYPEVLAKIASGKLRIPGYDRLPRANGRDADTPA
jgi:phosphoribosylglycinamide formyltransferase-1